MLFFFLICFFFLQIKSTQRQFDSTDKAGSHKTGQCAQETLHELPAVLEGRGKLPSVCQVWYV